MPLTTKQKEEMIFEIKHKHPKLQKYFIDLLVNYYDAVGNEGLKKLMEEDKKREAKEKKNGKPVENKPLEPIVICNVEKAEKMPEAPAAEVEVVRGKLAEVTEVDESVESHE